MGKPSPELSVEGMRKEDIHKRSDALRSTVIKLLTERGELSIKELAGRVRLSVPALRNHTRVLVKMGCIERRKYGLDTFYLVTDKPYVPERKHSHHKRIQNEVDVQRLPGARVIRLLDRNPADISKEEHRAARRSSISSSFTGCSMGMFDSF
jgi:DNA-binding Lrp family transcriptional regulator